MNLRRHSGASRSEEPGTQGQPRSGIGIVGAIAQSSVMLSLSKQTRATHA